MPYDSDSIFFICPESFVFTETELYIIVTQYFSFLSFMFVNTVYFLGPDPIFWELRFEIQCNMIVS